ncbi:hypothetical protein GCM10009555_018310 [Acrocarpospora macrocephala]|uniref:Uncharacterized protein n=1 Tax=Acrocarpospora macrocephala TaxID=150177 RepID=A0A5M3WJW9_9ACTN|nr:hypothetical protein [Acrocarpospora macrocephala]GES07491.1 hypothetical protein Amac_010860 [Acrocarpospora macrocephala]
MSTDRAAFTAGLRRLADLLDANPDMGLPFDGRAVPMSIYLDGDTATTSALALIAAMNEPAKPVIESNFLKIDGRVHGLRVEICLKPREVCEKRINAAYRDSQGVQHEVTEWVIPPALTEAVEARRTAGPLPVLHHPTYCGECGHDIRPVPMTDIQRVLDRHAAEVTADEPDEPHDQYCDCRDCADRARAAFRAAKREADRG